MVEHTEAVACDVYTAVALHPGHPFPAKAAAKAEGRYVGAVEVLYNYLGVTDEAATLLEQMGANLTEWGNLVHQSRMAALTQAV